MKVSTIQIKLLIPLVEKEIETNDLAELKFLLEKLTATLELREKKKKVNQEFRDRFVEKAKKDKPEDWNFEEPHPLLREASEIFSEATRNGGS